MPHHHDAIGFLRDLALSEDLPWFQMICDLATLDSQTALNPSNLECAVALFTRKASYLPQTPAATETTPTAASSGATDSLEWLGGFINFKRLDASLRADFTKRITLIFGANGSGKSSLCESLKILASQESPDRPITNLMEVCAASPAFSYKFKSDSSTQGWTSSVGYGPRRSTIKYFDTGIALKNVRSAVEPGRVVELTPFKLHVFESANAMTTQLRDGLLRAQAENNSQLNSDLSNIRLRFGNFEGHLLATIDEADAGKLSDEMKIGEGFSDEELLIRKKRELAEMEKGSSDQGLKLLKAEESALESFTLSMGSLIAFAEKLLILNPVTKSKELTAKVSEQEVLAKALIPTGRTLDELLSLARPASKMCNFEAAAGQACPLCGRVLDTPELDLFKQYSALLTGDLETAITSLRGEIKTARELLAAIEQIVPEDWDKAGTLPAEIISKAKSLAALVQLHCKIDTECGPEGRHALAELKALDIACTQESEQKLSVIDTAEKSRENLLVQLALVQSECKRLEYAKTISFSLEQLMAVDNRAKQAQFWNRELPPITPLLRKISTTAKAAHKELVVADFVTRLDEEYKALAEKDMTAFGVKLKDIGGEGVVTVAPQIGGNEIEGVLSEGEQRIHALALFFAELETCFQSVIVFDDPVSSFDYNYIENYCIRFRNYALKHTDRQIIVLTHNWEFFTQLQATLKRAWATGTNEYSVMILEGCSKVAEYSEKIVELKSRIEVVLAQPGEPSQREKEDLAGDMRRLIEIIVNKHVFADQRQQYKQRTQAVSEFQKFTKLVPLLDLEALDLKDLFGKLSKPEHDDERNSYAYTDKVMFQTRYDRIKAIEDAIIARK